MRVVIVFDSFKGSLTAEEAVAAAREGVLAALGEAREGVLAALGEAREGVLAALGEAREGVLAAQGDGSGEAVHPDVEIVGLPLADGGEGTAEVLCRLLDAKWTTCWVSDALFRPIEARYAVSRDGRTAMMEMAAAAGLTLLTEEERNPMQTTTQGVGEMILDAVERGCTRILVGIGGSATNDGGMGMLAALGVRFLDGVGEVLQPIGGNLQRIARIDWSGLKDLGGVTIDVICDVQNPLFGKDGAAYVFAPQKGASAEESEELDKGLRHFASLCKGKAKGGLLHPKQLVDFNPEDPGCGAAGGLGFGLRLLGANLRRGIDVVLDAANIDEHLQAADLVITGEGKIDRQTLGGKLPFGVLQRAQKHHVPTIALAGKIEDEQMLRQAGFRSVYSINPAGLSLADAMVPETAKQNLRTAMEYRLLSEV